VADYFRTRTAALNLNQTPYFQALLVAYIMEPTAPNSGKFRPNSPAFMLPLKIGLLFTEVLDYISHDRHGGSRSAAHDYILMHPRLNEDAPLLLATYTHAQLEEFARQYVAQRRLARGGVRRQHEDGRKRKRRANEPFPESTPCLYLSRQVSDLLASAAETKGCTVNDLLRMLTLLSVLYPPPENPVGPLWGYSAPRHPPDAKPVQHHPMFQPLHLRSAQEVAGRYFSGNETALLEWATGVLLPEALQYVDHGKERREQVRRDVEILLG